MTTQISVGRGFVALIDDEDADKVKEYRWRLLEGYVRGRGQYLGKVPSRSGKRYTRYVEVALHRLVMDAPDDMRVDHKDHNPLNCQKYNLRICTHAQNSFNKRKKWGTSRFKGVSWDSGHGKWRAHIGVNYKLIPLGDFDDETDAARAYNQAAVKHFGKFACLNDLEGEA